MDLPYGMPTERDDDPIPLRNEIEATLLDAILKEDGIPHFVKSFHDRAYVGIWQVQHGWGYVESPPQYKRGIRALLAVLRREAELPVWDDDEDDESYPPEDEREAPPTERP